MERVTFKNRSADVVGHLHVPDDHDGARPRAAIVCVHPGSGVKEQTAGLYARRLAQHGFVTLAFDASNQGESGGAPRDVEDPAVRVEDVRAAVDVLTTLDLVDDRRIGVLGICAGGGYAVNAALTERRIKAVGTVVPINLGRAQREGDGTPDFVARTLAAVAEQRTAEARGAEPLVTAWTPESREAAEAAGVADLDLLQAIDYYRTPRGGHERSANRLRFTSFGPMLAFDAFHLVEELLVQPLQVVVGDRVGSFGSYRDGHELYRRARGEKDLLVVDGASHYDLYDQSRFVDQAVARLSAFYGTHLGDQASEGEAPEGDGTGAQTRREAAAAGAAD